MALSKKWLCPLIKGLPAIFASAVAALLAISTWLPPLPPLAPRESLVWFGIAAAVLSGALSLGLLFRTGMPVRTRDRLEVIAVALLSTPLWAFGVLPQVNGYGFQGAAQQTVMQLKGVDSAPSTLPQAAHYWAYLSPAQKSELAAGAYPIEAVQFQTWHQSSPATVEVRWRRGLLGVRQVLSVTHTPSK